MSDQQRHAARVRLMHTFSLEDSLDRIMAAEYTIDRDRKLVTSRFWGTVTDDELHEHNQKLRADPDFDPHFRQLADMSEVAEIKVASRTINETSLDQFFNPGTRRAFVATAECVYGMARMFALRAEGLGQTIEVFRERDAAEDWLGI
jgi:hypothetical protein